MAERNGCSSPCPWLCNWPEDIPKILPAPPSLPEILMASDFEVPDAYDWKKSTEENYKSAASTVTTAFHGDFAEERMALDYNYHVLYDNKRLELHDAIIRAELSHTCHAGHQTNGQWVVFTAGAMGSGKTHTLRWLWQNGYFPLHAFVQADPDRVRGMLPELKGYIARSPEDAGEMTQKEAGYVAEVLTEAALKRGLSVIVDGSLQDVEWHVKYIAQLRERYGEARAAILSVTASPATVFERAASRAKITGRVIPESKLQQAIERVPDSVRILGPLADTVLSIENEGREPRLLTEGLNWERVREIFVEQRLCQAQRDHMIAQASREDFHPKHRL